MLAIVVIALGAVIAFARGGRLSPLPLFPWALVLIAALFAQFLTKALPAYSPFLIVGGNVLTLAFLLRNWNYLEFRIVFIGTCLNTLVIWSNGGYMPVLPTAAERLGMPLRILHHGYFWHAALTNHTVFPVLADLMYVPFPMPAVVSVGDLFVYMGIMLLVQRLLDRPVPLAELSQFRL